MAKTLADTLSRHFEGGGENLAYDAFLKEQKCGD